MEKPKKKAIGQVRLVNSFNFKTDQVKLIIDDVSHVDVRLLTQVGQLSVTLGLTSTATLTETVWTEGLKRLAVTNGLKIQDHLIVLDLGNSLLRSYVRRYGLPILWKRHHLFSIRRISRRQPWRVILYPGKVFTLPDKAPFIELT